MWPLGIVLRGRFLFVSTYEKKNGFLLIGVFRKLFNTQKYGHQDSILGSLLLFIRVSKNFAFLPK
jgi:hypothetical protein